MEMKKLPKQCYGTREQQLQDLPVGFGRITEDANRVQTDLLVAHAHGALEH